MKIKTVLFCIACNFLFSNVALSSLWKPVKGVFTVDQIRSGGVQEENTKQESATPFAEFNVINAIGVFMNNQGFGNFTKVCHKTYGKLSGQFVVRPDFCKSNLIFS